MTSSLRPRGPTERHASRDLEIVADAASALDITEFEFFRLAFRRWHGRLPAERSLERDFADHMLRQRTPAWVRSLAAEVLRRRRLGTLDPDVLGAGRFRDRPTRPRHAVISVAAALAVWFVFFAFLMQDVSSSPWDRVAMQTSRPAACTTGSAFHDAWAALLSGDADLGCGDDGGEAADR
ncbi:MAG: hypothetical protein EA405_10650 [Rhodospirillales bacterium]|nr:MAG: hypothetical protein EA405_10650 [Rhodospirillales bacterium]